MAQSAESSAFLDNKPGNCRILPGGGAYCTGIIPNEGFEIVRVLLRPWLTLDRGFEFIERYLESVGRPVQARPIRFTPTGNVAASRSRQCSILAGSAFK